MLGGGDPADFPEDGDNDDAPADAGDDEAPSPAASDRREFIPPTPEEVVDELNQNHAAVLIGSRMLVLQEREGGPLDDQVRFLSVEGFKHWQCNRFVNVVDKDGKDKSVTYANVWLTSYRRRQYEGIEFHPDPDRASGTMGYYNLYRGFGVAPRRGGSYAIFRDHLLTNVCGGDESLFRWVFGWFAHMLQRPRERLGTAIVFRGKQGVGKTVCGQVMGSLIPAHYMLVDNPRYLVGQFNAHLSSCLLLQADEGFWAGDKVAEGQLKGLVTSEWNMIEAKGVDPIRIRNYVHLLVTSNNDWVVPAGMEERRFCVIDVAEHVMQNRDYFGEMHRELDAGGREALLADLLSFDLSSVDLGHIPRTSALLEQKLRSLDTVQSWWFERLEAGAPARHLDDWPTEVSVDGLFEDYVKSADRIGVKRKAELTSFGMKLKRLVPGLQKRKRSYDEQGASRRTAFYLLPTLDDCREAFEQAL